MRVGRYDITEQIMRAIDRNQVIYIQNLDLNVETIHYARLLNGDRAAQCVRIKKIILRSTMMRIDVAKKFAEWIAKTKYLETVKWFTYDFHSIETMEYIAKGTRHAT